MTAWPGYLLWSSFRSLSLGFDVVLLKLVFDSADV